MAGMGVKGRAALAALALGTGIAAAQVREGGAGAQAPAPAQATMNQAYRLLKAKRNAEAIAAFNGVLKSDPDNHAALLELGYLHAGLKHWKSALPLLKKASEQDPENMRLHMDLGYAYQAQRQYDEAGKEFELVARQPGEFQEQAKGAIKTLRDSEETVRAAADARQGALVQQAYAALSAGNKPLARKRFVLVLSNDPRNKTALKQLGFLDLEEGKLRGAAQNFETVRSLDPQDYFAALQLGYVYQRLKDGDKAREAFTAALGSSDEKIHSAAQSALGPVAGPEQASRGPETLEAPQVPPTR